MRVQGEIAGLTRAASGHWYFSLRDSSASVKAVMFRGKTSLLDWQPKEGDQVQEWTGCAIRGVSRAQTKTLAGRLARPRA